METQTWFSCHYTFISSENIILFFVLSDGISSLTYKKSSDGTVSIIIFSSEINV